MTQAHLQTEASCPAALRSTPPAVVTLLRVSGEDAFSYLQSQVSADLRVQGECWVRYALWLDARGHVLADSFILREGAESFLLFSYSTPSDRLEEIVLSNVIADDVEVEQLGGQYRHWALYAGGAGEAFLSPPPLSSLLPESERFAVIASEGGEGAGTQLPTLLFAGRNAAGENYDLLIPNGTPLPPVVATLVEAPWAVREALRIMGGVPAVPQDIGTGDLPQEGGDLPRVAVSTAKGCYLGQEVIARWHATGQVRSGLFQVRLLAREQSAAILPQADAISPQAGTILSESATVVQGDSGTDSRATAEGVQPSFGLPLRLYAGTKSVGELRSFAEANGVGLALLRIHRLGESRKLCIEAGGAEVLEVMGGMLS